jgi:hypothetical protein
MSIQRYHAYHSGDPHKVGLWADPDGHWVQYDDHVAAVAEAEQRGYVRGVAQVQEVAYADGQRDERERIRKAVLGLVAWVVGPIRENGVVTRAVWLNKVLAVIDGEETP